MFIKSIILATIFLCGVKRFYCKKATVPYQVCTRYLEYKFTYKLNFTVDDSAFKDSNFTLSFIRRQLDSDSECNDPTIDLSINRTIHRGHKNISVNYGVVIEIKKEKQFNLSVLTRSTGEKMDECYKELLTKVLRLAKGRNSAYALNISGVADPSFTTHEDPQQRLCQIEIVYCPTGSEEVNSSCECSKGTSLDVNLTTCINCSKDTYQEQTGMLNCTPCQNGYTTFNKTGSTNKTACKPVTTTTTEPSTTTTPCPKGEYLKNGSCKSCPVNTYMDVSGNRNTSCTPCPSGLMTSKTGSIGIHLCVEGPDDSNALAITLSICLLVVVAIAGILCFYFWRKKKKREQNKRNTDIINAKFKVVENPRYVTPDNSSDEEADDNQLCTTLGHLTEDIERRNLEIPRDCITMTQVRLGRGNFGEVKQVIVRKSNEQEMLCAAKMARGANSYVSLQDMLDELEIHLKLEANHENVVNLIGVCSGNDGPFYLIMEYCDNGSLIEYLRKHADVPVYVNIESARALTLEWKLSRTLEICNGMKYLASHKIVHRDLAARNVLLDIDTVAKVSDFGMAKDVYLKSYYRQQREGSFPLRWMAIDSIQTFEFTEKTDVWSFGVLLWEIFTDGKLPYYDIIDDQKVAHYILNGKKLKRPEKCPKFLYNIMLKCWSNKSYNRPKFWELYDILDANIHPEKHGNPLKRRLSRNMLNAFSQTKSSLKRKISRKGSVKSKESADSAGRRRGSRKHSQSSFDRIINDLELQRLQNAMNNEGLDEETEAEQNSPSKKKREDENQNANGGLKDYENDIHVEKSPPSGRDKTDNLGHSSSTKPKITNLPENFDLPVSTLPSEGLKNQENANSSHVEVSKKVLPNGANNYAVFGAILNTETKDKNERRPQTADATAKYGSYQETTDLDDLADDTSEMTDDMSATVAENLPDTSVHDRTYSGKLNNNTLPEKELDPNTDSACGKMFDNSRNLTMDLDNNSSDETSTTAKEANTSSQDGIYPERRNNGSSPTNQDKDKADSTENDKENEKEWYDGVDLENSSDKAGTEDGQQKSSDGSDFLSDVLSAVKSFQNDDTAQTQNETDKEENPNSSSC